MRHPTRFSRREALQLLAAASAAPLLVPAPVLAQGAGSVGQRALGAAAYALAPRFVGERLERAFDATTVDEVMEILAEGQAVVDHADVQIDLPETAADGSSVPIQVHARIPGTRQISIIVPSNQFPLATVSEVPSHGEAYVSMRVRVQGTTQVIALAHNADGTVYRAERGIAVP